MSQIICAFSFVKADAEMVQDFAPADYIVMEARRDGIIECIFHIFPSRVRERQFFAISYVYNHTPLFFPARAVFLDCEIDLKNFAYPLHSLNIYVGYSLWCFHGKITSSVLNYTVSNGQCQQEQSSFLIYILLELGYKNKEYFHNKCLKN